MTSTSSGVLIAVLLALAVGWVAHALVQRPRAAAQRAVCDERIARLTAERDAARAAAQALGAAPEQVATAIAPVNVALGRLEAAVARADDGRAASIARLDEQLTTIARTTTASTEGLRRETARLVGALHHSEVRGRWGEFQLRRLLETSGLVAGVHFTEQPCVVAQAGTLRPDVILHLGSDKTVVVDAKVSLRAILSVTADDPDQERAAAGVQHAREVRAHVDSLSNKAYARQFDTAPEFVVMFLPAESLLSAALTVDPGLLEHAFDRNIVLATPTTLMALLRTVSHVWRQEEVAANAREIQALGRELSDRLAIMIGHLDKLGSALAGGVTAYNRTIASLETRVLVTGRRFAELQGKADAMPGPRQVEALVRPVAPAPEGETASRLGA